MSSPQVPDVHRHRAADPSSRDAAFIRSFLIAFVAASALSAGLVWLIDPFAVFGTGVLPPVVSADRDYKATLYRQLSEKPEVVILGSSRVKTLDPGCVRRLTGRTAFNFGINAGGADDFLAVFRFLRAQPGSQLKEIILGADPEALQEDHGFNRALAQSKAMARFAPPGVSPGTAGGLGPDLLSLESVDAAIRSLRHQFFDRDQIPEELLGPDGLQRYPLWEDELHRGAFPQEERVLGSIAGVLGRYESFPRLSPRKVDYLEPLVSEAHAAGIEVIAFIPPVHPALSRAAAAKGVMQQRTTETVDLLRGLEARGLLRYVETRALADFGGDSLLYFDAIHLMPRNATRLLETLLGHPGGCALQ